MPVALREKRLKLTPPSMTVAPRGTLRPVTWRPISLFLVQRLQVGGMQPRLPCSHLCSQSALPSMPASAGIFRSLRGCATYYVRAAVSLIQVNAVQTAKILSFCCHNALEAEGNSTGHALGRTPRFAGHLFWSSLALLLRKEFDERLAASGVMAEWGDVVRDLDHHRAEHQTLRAAAADAGLCRQGVFRAVGVALPPLLRQLPNATSPLTTGDLGLSAPACARPSGSPLGATSHQRT